VRRSDPKEVVRGELKPGEQVVWCGQPDVDAAMAGYGGGLPMGFLIVFGGVVALVIVQSRPSGAGLVETLQAVLALNPMLPVILGVMLLAPFALRIVKLDGRSRYRRYFERSTYAITDQRVLVIEKDDVQAFEADSLDQPRLVERTAGYGDVLFARQRLSTDSDGRPTRDPVARERAKVGFKALPDAEAVLARLERWIAGELEESAAEVSDFVAARQHPADVLARRDGTATLRQPTTGLSIDHPEEWSVRVRKKKKPFGKTFFDREKWLDPDESDDWNYARIEGPTGCVVDVEVFETPLMASYETMVGSRLASMAGELVDSDPEYEQHGMRGFRLTRRSDVQANQVTGPAGTASLVTPFRTTVLHDGRHQLTLISKWPERSSELAAAVDLVVRSARLG
jgi:hypothetical protein